MAEIFPNEGIDYIMAIFPKNGTNVATLYIFLFTGGSASTVPAATATIGTMGGGFAEATGTAYARKSIASTDWQAQAGGSPDGRQSTGNQMTMATVGAGGWGTVNGFGIASLLTLGVAIFYSNFSDVTGVVTASGDILKITPTIGLGA